MGEILEVDAKDFTNFIHNSLSAGLFVVAFHVITPVDFVDFACGSASTGDFEVSGEGEHGDVACFLIEADYHNGVSELCAVVSTVAFVAFHIITAGAKC